MAVVPAGVIVAWPGTVASIPAGWTRVAALDGVYPKGDTATAGTTGGGSHTHSIASHLHTVGHSHANQWSSAGASGGAAVNNFGLVAYAGHGHATVFAASSRDSGATASTSDATTIALSRVVVVFIQSDGTPTALPAGAIMWANAAIAPAAWNICDGTGDIVNLVPSYLAGAATGTDGGTATVAAAAHTHTTGTHTHTAPAHTDHGITFGSASSTGGGAAGSITAAAASHTHTANTSAVASAGSGNTGTSSTASGVASATDPPYTQLLPVRAASARDYATLATNLIAWWVGTAGAIPAGWALCDGSNGTPSLGGRYILGATSGIGTTGGAATHTHDASHTHTVAITHTHTVSGTSSTSTTSSTGDPGATGASDVVSHSHSPGTPTGAAQSWTCSSGGGTSGTGSNEPAYSTVLYIMYIGIAVALGEDTSGAVVARLAARRVAAAVRTLLARTTAELATLLPFRSVPLGSDLRWGVGGSVQRAPDLRWGVGGRAGQVRTLQWRVAPSPNRVQWALYTSPVVYTFRYERRTRGNQFLADVSAAISRASVELNNDRDILRTAQFTVDASARDDRGAPITINPMADHIAVIMQLLVDGSYLLDLPMGLFALTTPRRRIEPSGETWEVEGGDLGVHLVEATTTSSYSVAAGANYITGSNAVASILATFGLTYALPSVAVTLPVAMSWPPGTPWLRVINDLLQGCNLYSLWFDASGVARSRAPDALTGRSPDVTYQDTDFVLVPLAEESDTTRFANQVIAVIDDPNRPPLSSVATNSDPGSAISTVNLGRTITKIVRSDRAADQATLDAIALRALRDAASMYKRATLLTSIDPRRDAHEVYRLNIPGVYAGDSWWVRNWRADLVTGGEMRHALGRVERVEL